MGKRFFWAAVSVSASFALAIACGGDDSSGSTNDGGPGDGTTSDVSSSDGSRPGDSGTKDSGADGGSGLVTVVALDFPGGRAPTDVGPGIPGAIVLFADPSGTPITTTTTDANGKASAVAPAGSSVTVIIQVGSQFDITSITDVAPGDDLVAYSQQLAYNPTPNGSTTLAFPAGDAGDGVSGFYASVGCGYNGLSPTGNTLANDPSCVVGGKVNAVAWDGNLASNVPSYATQANADLVDGGATISGWSWSPASQKPVAMTGALPSDATNVYTEFLLRGGGITYAWFLHDAQNVDAGTISPFTLGVPSPAASFIDNYVQSNVVGRGGDDAGHLAVSSVIDVANMADASFTADYASLPARLHNPVLSYDASTRTLSGGVGVEGASSGLVGLTMTGFSDFDPTDGGDHVYISWTVVTPFAASFTLPALPTALATQFAVPNGPIQVGAAFAMGGSAIPDYAAFKPRFMRYQESYLIDPTVGRVLMSIVGSP